MAVVLFSVPLFGISIGWPGWSLLLSPVSASVSLARSGDLLSCAGSVVWVGILFTLSAFLSEVKEPHRA